jgi:hypothetical protein
LLLITFMLVFEIRLTNKEDIHDQNSYYRG